MSLGKRISDLEAALSEARFEIVELRRRVRDMIRIGRVKKVDAKTGRIDVVDEPEGGDRDERLDLEGIPWLEAGANPQGGLQTWNPPREGAQVVCFAADGNLSNACAVAAAYSDDAKAPSQDPDTRVARLGDLTVRQKGENYFVFLGQESDQVHVEISKERVRGRHGQARYVAKPNLYAKIRYDKTWVIAKAEGVIVSHLPKIGDDPDHD